MSQQINLYSEEARHISVSISAHNMLQAVIATLLLAGCVYGYLLYHVNDLSAQHEESVRMLAAEQKRLDALSTDYARQRAGVTLEQEQKQLEAELFAQRAIIDALKNGVIGNTGGYSEYMSAFARQMVQGIQLTGFVIEGNAAQMSLRGAALAPDLVPSYIMRLNNEAVMRGKTFASLQMRLPDEDGQSGRRYLEFELKSVLAAEVAKP